MASTAVITALVFMCMVTLTLGISQTAINNITNGQGQSFNGCGALFNSAYTNGIYNDSGTVDTSKLQNTLPGSATTSPGGSGFFVVDWIASAANWMKGQINIFTEVASGPYCALHSIPNIPNALVVQIAAMWYIIGLLLFAAFVIGR